jgi:hypothetical protein
MSKVVQDPTKAEEYPIGTELPLCEVFGDFCTKCGTFRATKVYEGKAVKTVKVPPNKLFTPGLMPNQMNRMQRRNLGMK